jgi:hypothetical protein
MEKEFFVEKQTNPDRLTALPWDEDKTWKIIGEEQISEKS